MVLLTTSFTLSPVVESCCIVFVNLDYYHCYYHIGIAVRVIMWYRGRGATSGGAERFGHDARDREPRDHAGQARRAMATDLGRSRRAAPGGETRGRRGRSERETAECVRVQNKTAERPGARGALTHSIG